MADRRVEGIVKAMDSIARINQENYKLKRLMLLNDQKTQQNFIMGLEKMRAEQGMKNQNAPLELELERQKKQIMSPKDQLEYDRTKNIDTSSGEYEVEPSGKVKKLGLKGMAERVYQKPEEDWNDNDRNIVDRYKKFSGVTKTSKPSREYDPTLTQSVLDKLIAEDKSDADFQLDLEDLKKNSSLYEKAGVDVGTVMNSALKHPRLAPTKKSIFGKLKSAWGEIWD